ncbi:MAG: hypothetical protein KAZ18_01265, partial [Acinetobacter sp.]|nr:hypothetical protein [Acinetobacter sp.]
RPKLEQKLNKLLRLTFLIAIKKPQAFNTSLGSLNLGPEGRTRRKTLIQYIKNEIGGQKARKVRFMVIFNFLHVKLETDGT